MNFSDATPARRSAIGVPPLACLAAGGAFIFNLFYLGAKPIAVGLFPEPWDKLAHFAAFCVLTLLLHFGTRGRWPWLVLVTTAAVGGLDELHQIWLPGRVADVNDFAADCFGVVLTLVPLQFQHLRRSMKNERAERKQLP